MNEERTRLRNELKEAHAEVRDLQKQVEQLNEQHRVSETEHLNSLKEMRVELLAEVEEKAIELRKALVQSSEQRTKLEMTEKRLDKERQFADQAKSRLDQVNDTLTKQMQEARHHEQEKLKFKTELERKELKLQKYESNIDEVL